jgi:hypothetical protein
MHSHMTRLALLSLAGMLALGSFNPAPTLTAVPNPTVPANRGLATLADTIT